MHEQLTLTLPRDVRFTSRHLLLPALSHEEFLDVGRYLAKARGALAFWIADWREEFRSQHGSDKVREAMQQLEFEGEDWKAIEALNRLHERVEALSPEHHFVLAKKAAKAEDQKVWAELAQKEKLTPRELELSIRKGTVTRIEVHSLNRSQMTGFASLESVCVAFRRYRAQVGEQWQQWQRETTSEVLADLAEIVTFAAELERRLVGDNGRERNG